MLTNIPNITMSMSKELDDIMFAHEILNAVKYNSTHKELEKQIIKWSENNNG